MNKLFNLFQSSNVMILEAITVFLTISVVLIITEFRHRKLIRTQEDIDRQKIYQISVLKEIQDKIGYSLDLEKTLDVITGSLKHLFPYSTVASLLLKENKLIFKIEVEESVNSSFISEVRKNMVDSLFALVGSIPQNMEVSTSGLTLDETKTAPVGSFFNIPLVIGNNVLGLINISSNKTKLYSEQEMTIVYQIVGQASIAISRLKYVLDTEKGKLTSMISSLVDGVFMIDKKNNLLILNNAAKNFFGISADNPTFVDILTSIGNQYDLLTKIHEVTSTNTPIEEKEIQINDRIFQLFITPVPNANEMDPEKTIGASILLHDITIEKNITRIKEDFTHMIVHELRAPLTAIKDSSELMIEVFEDRGGLEKEQQKRLLKIIDTQSKNLLEQINQVLDAAKIEAGSFSINKTPSDIGEVIETAIETFFPPAKKKQILLLTDIYYPLPKIDIDPVRIGQVLNNLISNSLKFTPEGGKIIVSAKPSDGILTVAVTDNGMGIALADQKDLFSKYYQIRTTPRELAKKGTGLGLYITKGIVEAHNGSVGVKSEPGKGTSIYFNLPMEGGPRIIQGHLPQNLPNLPSTVN